MPPNVLKASRVVLATGDFRFTKVAVGLVRDVCAVARDDGIVSIVDLSMITQLCRSNSKEAQLCVLHQLDSRSPSPANSIRPLQGFTAFVLTRTGSRTLEIWDWMAGDLNQRIDFSEAPESVPISKPKLKVVNISPDRRGVYITVFDESTGELFKFFGDRRIVRQLD